MTIAVPPKQTYFMACSRQVESALARASVLILSTIGRLSVSRPSAAARSHGRKELGWVRRSVRRSVGEIRYSTIAPYGWKTNGFPKFGAQRLIPVARQEIAGGDTNRTRIL